jgi:hypothetical protein
MTKHRVRNGVLSVPAANDTYICPACAAPAIYSHAVGQFFHADGSDNGGCWIQLAGRGARYDWRDGKVASAAPTTFRAP